MSAIDGVSEIFDADAWDLVPGFELMDVTYHRAKAHGTVRIAFDPENGRRLGGRLLGILVKPRDTAQRDHLWQDVTARFRAILNEVSCPAAFAPARDAVERTSA